MGRLWWRCWPQLMLLVLLRNLIGSLLLDASVAVGLRNHALGLVALSVPVLVDLLLIVAMFHVLKPWLPSVAQPEARAPVEPPPAGRREAFLHGVALALVPFFAVYSAWGLLGNLVRSYSLRGLAQSDLGSSVVLLDAVGARGVVATVLSTWCLRHAAKVLDARRPRPWWKIAITLCEAIWLFLGLFVLTAWKRRLVDWWETRAAHAWLADLADGVFGRVPAELVAALGAVWELFLFALLPLVWLALAALIYGVDVQRTDELTTASPRMRRLAEGYRRLPRLVHHAGERLVSGARTRFVPVVNGVRRVLVAGLPLLVILAVGYRALDWLSLWGWIGATHLIGPRPIEEWRIIGDVLGLVLVDPLRIAPSLVVEPLRICLLAAVLETMLARGRGG
jgi:hypothetical protein